MEKLTPIRATAVRISLTKKVFTSQEADFIREKLKLASERGFVTRRFENNRYLLASYKGVDDKGISPKWNVKI